MRDPLWYKDAVIYELHVGLPRQRRRRHRRLPGLTASSTTSSLGVTALAAAVLPVALRDDGYDIADYTSVHPAYGDLGASAFLHEAHRRGLRVITELVLNHTSDQHPWFQRARRAKPGTLARDFYVWSDTRTNTATPASSSRTSRRPTGPGIRWPRPTTGTASTPTSRT